ncbi:porin family protein [Bacteroides togonis]|uniref:porin family protein n=1 Tax=Bacteroides togonis TaxID=1917883 RepID=UPI00094AF2FB|nr:porin family protein [Bacteroides togonis]
MKKVFSILLVAVCCLALATPAQAQLKWGVKGGVNMSKIDWNGGYEGNKDNSAGFFIGPMAEFTIPVIGLGIDGAVMYSQRGEDDFKQQGVEIPVNLKYTLGLGSMFGIYVAAGPDFFFNFKDVDLQGLEAKKTQVGLNIGAGVKLVKHLQIGVNYQIPLGDSFTWKNVQEADFKTKTWQISLAYMF